MTRARWTKVKNEEGHWLLARNGEIVMAKVRPPRDVQRAFEAVGIQFDIGEVSIAFLNEDKIDAVIAALRTPPKESPSTDWHPLGCLRCGAPIEADSVSELHELNNVCKKCQETGPSQ